VVNSLLGTDWYMNELRYKINKSAAFDIIFTPEQIQGSRRDVAYIAPLPGFDQKKYYDLYDILKNVVGSDDPKYTQQQDEDILNLMPVKKLTVPVDLEAVKAAGLVKPGDSVLSELKIDIGNRSYLLKNDLAIYAVIAANHWKRPICFTSTQELKDLGLDKYVQLTGLSYQLVPFENKSGAGVETAAAYNAIMNHFAYGGAEKPEVYYDEENRRHLNSIRMAHTQVAFGLVEEGKKDSARNILEHFDKNVRESNFPYGMTSNRGNQQDAISTDFLQACFVSGDTVLAKKVEASVKKDLQQQMRYYKSLGDETSDDQLGQNAYMLLQGKGGTLSDRQLQFTQDIFTTYRMLMQIDQMDKQFNGKPALDTKLK